MKKLIAAFAVVALLAGIPALAFAATSQQAECPGQGVCAQGANFVDEDDNGVCDNYESGDRPAANGNRPSTNGECPAVSGDCPANNGDCPRADDGTCPVGSQNRHGNGNGADGISNGNGQGASQGGSQHQWRGTHGVARQ